MKIRSFLAFDIPDGVKEELGKAIAVLSPKVRGLRWVRPDRMHCTIRFFGDVEEELLMGRLSDVIEREVRHQTPIGLAAHGIGVFPNWRYPRVLWAGIEGETDAIISLHAKLEEAFSEFGLVHDPRVLRLHLTLARAKAPIKDGEALVGMVEKMGEQDFGAFRVDSLTLYKSVLTREGPIYTPLRSFQLGSEGRKGKKT
jgi:2'-5' RNA ligase